MIFSCPSARLLAVRLDDRRPVRCILRTSPNYSAADFAITNRILQKAREAKTQILGVTSTSRADDEAMACRNGTLSDIGEAVSLDESVTSVIRVSRILNAPLRSLAVLASPVIQERDDLGFMDASDFANHETDAQRLSRTLPESCMNLAPRITVQPALPTKATTVDVTWHKGRAVALSCKEHEWHPNLRRPKDVRGLMLSWTGAMRDERLRFDLSRKALASDEKRDMTGTDSRYAWHPNVYGKSQTERHGGRKRAGDIPSPRTPRSPEAFFGDPKVIQANQTLIAARVLNFDPRVTVHTPRVAICGQNTADSRVGRRDVEVYPTNFRDSMGVDQLNEEAEPFVDWRPSSIIAVRSPRPRFDKESGIFRLEPYPDFQTSGLSLAYSPSHFDRPRVIAKNLRSQVHAYERGHCLGDYLDRLRSYESEGIAEYRFTASEYLKPIANQFIPQRKSGCDDGAGFEVKASTE